MSARIRQILYTSAVKCGFIANSNNQRSRRQAAGVLMAKIVVLAALATFSHKLLIATSRHYAFVRSVGGFGSGNGQFNWPHGIAADASGNLWVADTYNGRLQEFAGDGKFLQVIGANALSSPYGVAIDPFGNIWVTDTFAHRVHQFTISGTLLRTLGTTGSEEGQLRYPAGITADSLGNIWVADSINNRIQEFTGTGEFVKAFGSLGPADGQLLDPRGVAVDAAGNVWVADGRIQEFTSTGALSQVFRPEDHSSFFGITLDRTGDIWATSGVRLSEFTSGGALILELGSERSASGQFYHSQAVAMDPHGNVWVADTGNNRIVEFSPVSESSTLAPLTIGGALCMTGRAWRAKRLPDRSLPRRTCNPLLTEHQLPPFAAVFWVLLGAVRSKSAARFGSQSSCNPAAQTLRFPAFPCKHCYPVRRHFIAEKSFPRYLSEPREALSRAPRAAEVSSGKQSAAQLFISPPPSSCAKRRVSVLGCTPSKRAARLLCPFVASRA
jgi:DNA-binding beta-propeller fold protein YncE